MKFKVFLRWLVLLGMLVVVGLAWRGRLSGPAVPPTPYFGEQSLIVGATPTLAVTVIAPPSAEGSERSGAAGGGGGGEVVVTPAAGKNSDKEVVSLVSKASMLIHAVGDKYGKSADK